MKKILIPYDFSDQSENILNYGLSLAKDIKAEIQLLHISPFPVVTPEAGIPAFSYQDIVTDSRKELDRIAGSVSRDHPGLQVTCFAEMGDVSATITEFCEKHPVDFVVMGISQHGNKLMQLLMGSNAVETALNVKSTVIIVPPGVTYKTPKHCAFASDKSDASSASPSLEKATKISGLFGAELQMLHVVSDNHQVAPGELVLNNYFERRSEDHLRKLFIITEKRSVKASLKCWGTGSSTSSYSNHGNTASSTGYFTKV
jgi:nucleotide-binding universal stress UspA family protein